MCYNPRCVMMKGKVRGYIMDWERNSNSNDNDKGDDESDRDVLNFCFVSNLKVSQALLNFVIH